jgi:hypothetical protein
MRSDPRPYIDDPYGTLDHAPPSLLARARGVIAWVLGLALLGYMLMIAAVGFLMR